MKVSLTDLLNLIRDDLLHSVDAKTQASFQRFFKEPVRAYGVKTGIVSRIARKYQSQIDNLSKKDFFSVCESLLAADYCEEAFLVSYWAPRFIDIYTESDLEIFESWIDRYINNWAKCDGFCNHTIGSMIDKFPTLVPRIKKWATSQNRWLKRAAAVSFIIPAKHGRNLKDVFDLAEALMLDREDMVQKGYGWLLKEASRIHQQEVYDYVVAHRQHMPRTALRYAIELMPKNLRLEAMKRE